MATQSAQVTAKNRSELGSRANKRLRDAGLIPAVIYGHKEAVVPVTLTRKEIAGHLNHGTHVFDLALDGGKAEKVLVKEVQYDHLGIEVLHVDFARVSLDETVEITVPLELKGEPKGEADGGVLQQLMSDLEVECRVTDIPAVIVHNVSEMALDDELRIKDLKLPPGVRALADEDQLVATCKAVEEEVVEGAEAATAEPEVIGRVADEGEAAKAE